MKIKVTQVQPQFTIEVTGTDSYSLPLTAPPGFREIPNSQKRIKIFSREMGNSTPRLIEKILLDWIWRETSRVSGDLVGVGASVEVPIRVCEVREGKRTERRFDRK